MASWRLATFVKAMLLCAQFQGFQIPNMSPQSITFSRDGLDFTTTLNQRVSEYFRARKISKQGNREMFIKTIFMFFLYLFPYLSIITGFISHPVLLLIAVVVMI